jgi:hypothetical protein
MTLNELDLRPCDQCGNHFSPRNRSGGSPQRFCTSGCRLGFHTERLRRQRKAPYAGRSLRAATPTCDDKCRRQRAPNRLRADDTARHH